MSSRNRGGVGYQYRQEYLKKNKGIFGLGIYICPYCGLPGLLKNSHIDHIMPKSKSERVFNRQYNLIATHPKCNQKKSDKIDRRVVQGYTAKMFGGIIGAILNPIIALISLPFKVTPRIIQGLLGVIGNIIGIIFSTLGSVIKGTFGMIISLFFKPIIIVVVILAIVLYIN